jgi:heat shock protein HslJ
MSLKQEETIKKNLAFVYGRAKGQEIIDPDKHSYIRTSSSSRETEAFIGETINSFTGEYEYLAPAYPCSVCLGELMHLVTLD